MKFLPRTAGTSELPEAAPPRPRWHLVYFLLAAFDVFTVSMSLYLNDRIMRIYTRSVEVNRAWTEMLHDASRLGQTAAAVNAPGNDVFASHRVEVEAANLRQALQGFHAELGALREKVESR